MLRRSQRALTPFKVGLSLPCAAALAVALAGTTLAPQRAWPADLRLEPKPAEETPLERQKRRFEEFLRYLQKQKQ